jgi:predicted alpha/beta hydrolase family esterase
MKKYTHLILHGSYGSDEGNWTPWLKEQLESSGFSVLAPQLPVDDWNEAIATGKELFTPKNQTLENWLQAFEALLPELDTTNLTVYAHSSAPLFILHVLTRHPELTIKKAYFVAPFLGKIGDNWPIEKVNESFYAPADFDYEALSKQIDQSLVFYSDNDPYVTANYSVAFAEKINAVKMLLKGAGHFNTEAGVLKLPQLLDT